MHVGGWYEGNHHSYLWEIPVFFFFLGDISPNFNLKNMNLTYAKEF